LADILNKINAFIGIFDVQNHKLLWVNKYFTKKTGYSLSALLNMTSDELLWQLHPDQREILIKECGELKDNWVDCTSSLYKIRTRGNQWTWVLVNLSLFERNRNGQITKALVYATEINILQLYNQVSISIDQGKADEQQRLIKLLSAREKKVVSLISGGKSDKEISEDLGISIHTAKTHRKKIIRKLNLRKTSTLVKYAIEKGLG
jgi:DNA-binding CsgD family transcriptional regulator